VAAQGRGGSQARKKSGLQKKTKRGHGVQKDWGVLRTWQMQSESGRSRDTKRKNREDFGEEPFPIYRGRGSRSGTRREVVPAQKEGPASASNQPFQPVDKKSSQQKTPEQRNGGKDKPREGEGVRSSRTAEDGQWTETHQKRIGSGGLQRWFKKKTLLLRGGRGEKYHAAVKETRGKRTRRNAAFSEHA